MQSKTIATTGLLFFHGLVGFESTLSFGYTLLSIGFTTYLYGIFADVTVESS